jgi:hypothetical protein
LIPLVSTITAIISLSTWIHNELTNENEVSGEVDSPIDGIQSPIEQTRETVVRRTGRHTKKPDRYGDYHPFSITRAIYTQL